MHLANGLGLQKIANCQMGVLYLEDIGALKFDVIIPLGYSLTLSFGKAWQHSDQLVFVAGNEWNVEDKWTTLEGEQILDNSQDVVNATAEAHSGVYHIQAIRYLETQDNFDEALSAEQNYELFWKVERLLNFTNQT